MKYFYGLWSLALIWLFSSMPVFAQMSDFDLKQCRGAIYRPGNTAPLQFSDIVKDIENADVIVFGERHSSIEHSVASSCILEVFAQKNKKVSLIMEIISSSYTSRIAKYRTDPKADAVGLGVSLEWWDSGWPSFLNWQPLIDRAFKRNVALFGGDIGLEDKKTRAVTPEEEKEFQQVYGDRLEGIRSGWQRAITEAHCGLIDQKEARRLANHQIRRDLSIVKVAQERLKVDEKLLLHVNRGHARADRALVPALKIEPPKKRLVIGAFLESETIRPEQRAAFDLIWVLGEAKRPDVCSVLKGKS